MATAGAELLPNYLGGAWHTATSSDALDVMNPATGETLGRVPLSSAEDVGQVVAAASRAFDGWRRTPPTERIQYLFAFKQRLEAEFEDLARTITMEAGKTLGEARGEIRRGIENVECAAGIPSLSMGYNVEDIASGIDEMMIRQPLGVVAAITPFNFPGMIPLWFLPYAIACGNCFILKPSERVPLTSQKVFETARIARPAAGRRQPRQRRARRGRRAARSSRRPRDLLRRLLARRAVRLLARGRGRQARPVPGRRQEPRRRDARRGRRHDGEADDGLGVRLRRPAMPGRVGGGAGRRSAADVHAEAARSRRRSPRGLRPRSGRGNGPGHHGGEPDADRRPGRARPGEGGRVLVDGRQPQIAGYEQGHFVRPTVVEIRLDRAGELAQTEIFGPVLSLTHVNTLDDAIAAVNASAYGNMACIFTSSGAAARKFRYEVRAGNIGINIGVAAPMAFFPFSGWKGSFFGDLHAQGRDAVEFYTDKKVVVERWPKEWTRQF